MTEVPYCKGYFVFAPGDNGDLSSSFLGTSEPHREGGAEGHGGSSPMIAKLIMGSGGDRQSKAEGDGGEVDPRQGRRLSASSLSNGNHNDAGAPAASAGVLYPRLQFFFNARPIDDDDEVEEEEQEGEGEGEEEDEGDSARGNEHGSAAKQGDEEFEWPFEAGFSTHDDASPCSEQMRELPRYRFASQSENRST
jgi:hypothetical protein